MYYYIYAQFAAMRAAQNDLAGRLRPTGRSLPTPALQPCEVAEP